MPRQISWVIYWRPIGNAIARNAMMSDMYLIQAFARVVSPIQSYSALLRSAPFCHIHSSGDGVLFQDAYCAPSKRPRGRMQKVREVRLGKVRTVR